MYLIKFWTQLPQALLGNHQSWWECGLVHAMFGSMSLVINDAFVFHVTSCVPTFIYVYLAQIEGVLKWGLPDHSNTWMVDNGKSMNI